MNTQNRKKHNYECLNELFESIDETYLKLTRFLYVLDFGPGVKDPARDSETGRELSAALDRFADIYAANRDKLLAKITVNIDRIK